MNRIIVWHRRDLRTTDNTALFRASEQTTDIIPVFIFDDGILRRDDIAPVRVAFLLESLEDLAAQYEQLGGRLIIRRGKPNEELIRLVRESEARAVFFNDDYEPYAVARDKEVKQALGAIGIEVKSFKDHVLFAGGELETGQGKPYTVFTPYKKNWLSQSEKIPNAEPAPKQISTLPVFSDALPSLIQLEFTDDVKKLQTGGTAQATVLLENLLSEKLFDYADKRNDPALDATSRLSPHFKFGTLSIRDVYHRVQKRGRDAEMETHKRGVEVFTAELVWRDFYYQILDRFPFVAERSFKPDTQTLRWENRDDYFEAWKAGQTGFPIVDAAMRQLNETGWMHNRLRMIVASFLTKDLLIDWRWGEKYFMQRLIDGDLAANNGGWQWSASTGTDAQPYFRIFNPASQSEKFDAEGAFIRRFVPELKNVPAKFIHAPDEAINKSPLFEESFGVQLGKEYPKPIVDHKVQREKALAMFKDAGKKE